MNRLLHFALALSMFGSAAAYAGTKTTSNVQFSVARQGIVPGKRTWKKEIWGIKTASRAAVVKEMTSALQAKYGKDALIKVELMEPHGSNVSFQHDLSIPQAWAEVTVNGQKVQGTTMIDATKGKVQVAIAPETFEFENKVRAARGLPSVQHDLRVFEAKQKAKDEAVARQQVAIDMNRIAYMGNPKAAAKEALTGQPAVYSPGVGPITVGFAGVTPRIPLVPAVMADHPLTAPWVDFWTNAMGLTRVK